MSRGKWLFLFSVALAVVAIDQVTKAAVVTNLALYEAWAPIEALRDYFTIVHVTNTGAAFGILPGGGMLFLIIAFVVVGVIFYFYRQLTDQSWLVRLALGLQLGGAVGNLIDRLRLGYVVDFIDVKLSDTLDWPVFNIADSSIVVGVGLLLILLWFVDRQQKKAEAESAATPQPMPPDDTHVTPIQPQQPPPLPHDQQP